MTKLAGSLGEVVDLHNCDQEQIHIPQAIQPHGLYLGLCPQTRAVTAASANSATILGRPAADLLGLSIFDVVGRGYADELAAMLREVSPRANQALAIDLPGADGQARPWELTTHLFAGCLAVELEPDTEEKFRPSTLNCFVQQAMSKLRETRDLASLSTMAASLVRTLTDFDRIVVYRFDENNNGNVIAEDRVEQVNALLGLHFPASDIPAQARQMYVDNSLRAIPEVHYKPVEIVTGESLRDGPPIDLTQAVLRSVSPIHREYMKNMGLSASMSVSLLHEGRLWGLLSCSNERGPPALSFAVRSTCQTLGDMTALLIDSKERNTDTQDKLRLKYRQSRLLYRVNQSTNFTEALTQGSPNLLDVTNASGAAIFYNDVLTLTGKTPSQGQVMDLLKWLREKHPSPLFVSQALPAAYPVAEAFKDTACGLIAAAMTRGRNSYVLWFRGEVLQTIHWGGDPSEPKHFEPTTMRMHPRRSFAAYRQLVHLTSLPWKEAEREAAAETIRSINDIVLQKAEELQRLNRDMTRSNHELDAFAYAASHDLKEPLRGISNYTELALEELRDGHLVGDSARCLGTVVKLTRRMEDLINSLLHYSHLGRAHLTMADVNLNEVVAHVREMTAQRLRQTETELRVERALPTVRGDPVLLGELFANLITNAIKYNDKSQKWLEVGYRAEAAGGKKTMYVRDNGIGIEPRNFQSVFKIFRRLHGRDDFGGGTGTGLTIARQIVQRHGGQVWVESAPQQGSTFLFSLPNDRADA